MEFIDEVSQCGGPLTRTPDASRRVPTCWVAGRRTATFCFRRLTVLPRASWRNAILSHLIVVSANRMKLDPWRPFRCEKLAHSFR